LKFFGGLLEIDQISCVLFDDDEDLVGFGLDDMFQVGLDLAHRRGRENGTVY
jgi:hypothetical protein